MDPVANDGEAGPTGHGALGAEGVRDLHVRAEPDAKGARGRPRAQAQTNVDGLQSHQHSTSKQIQI